MGQELQAGTNTLTESEQAAFGWINNGHGTAEYDPDSSIFCVIVDMRQETTDADLEKLTPLAAKLDWLNLGETKITPAGLASIAKLKRLHTLLLHNTQIDGEGLKHLGPLENLVVLRIDGTRVRGEDLVHLKDLPRLERIVISSLPITIEHLYPLCDMRSLEELSIDGTQITKLEHRVFQLNLPSWQDRLQKYIPQMADSPELVEQIEAIAPPEYTRLHEAIQKSRELARRRCRDGD